MGMRTPGGRFLGGALAGSVVSRDSDGQVGFQRGETVAAIGQDQISRHANIAANIPDRVLTAVPKYMNCLNRAKLGNVKVWCSAFNGVLYPEGANDDRSTWLQPGGRMQLTAEEAIFFFGDFLVPKIDVKSAREVIERYGGFQLEAKGRKTNPNDPARIIGGPIGLPDIVVQPMDSRMRQIGAPIAIYEIYVKATRHLIVRPTNFDPELASDERDILLARLADYEEDDGRIYGLDGEELSAQTNCSCSPIAHERGVVGCQYSSTKGMVLDAEAIKQRPIRDPEDPDQTEPMKPDDTPEETKPPGGQRPKRQ